MAPREIRPPGVYPLGAGARYTSLTIADTHIVGFVGIANRGPLDVPVQLQSWAEFVEVYGPSSEGYLARAVEGFFLNGGRVLLRRASGAQATRWTASRALPRPASRAGAA
jgi:hypothetical protein